MRASRTHGLSEPQKKKKRQDNWIHTFGIVQTVGGQNNVQTGKAYDGRSPETPLDIQGCTSGVRIVKPDAADSKIKQAHNVASIGK
jgi:hypothetical protein